MATFFFPVIFLKEKNNIIHQDLTPADASELNKYGWEMSGPEVSRETFHVPAERLGDRGWISWAYLEEPHRDTTGHTMKSPLPSWWSPHQVQTPLLEKKRTFYLYNNADIKSNIMKGSLLNSKEKKRQRLNKINTLGITCQ